MPEFYEVDVTLVGVSPTVLVIGRGYILRLRAGYYPTRKVKRVS
jgi:hypothetical protein